MSTTVYIEKQITDQSIYNTNDTGAALAQYEFCLIGPYAAIADQVIDISGNGTYTIEGEIEMQVDDLKAGEDTFGTLYQDVYWDDTTKEFSDTETAGYYFIGNVSAIKDANGVVKVLKILRHELITT